MFFINREIFGFLVLMEIYFVYCRRNERMYEIRLMNVILLWFIDIFRVFNFILFSI